MQRERACGGAVRYVRSVGNAERKTMTQGICRLYLYLDQEKYVEECIQGLIKDNADALSDLELVVLNALGTPKTQNKLQSCRELLKDRMREEDCTGMTAQEAYEKYLSTEGAATIGLIKATTIYQKGSLGRLRAILAKKPVKAASLEPVFYNQNNTFHYYLKFKEPRNEVIHLQQQLQWFQTYIGGYLFDASLFEGEHFDTSLKYESLFNMLFRLLDKAGDYWLDDKQVTIREYTEADVYNYSPMYEKDWYTDHIRSYVIPCLKQNRSRLTQFAMLFTIAIKFRGNQNDRNKSILLGEEKEEFYEAVREALQYIEDDIILYNGNFEMKREMPRYMYYAFYVQKHGGSQPQITFGTAGGEEVAKVGDLVIEKVSSMCAEIMAINDEKDCLEIWTFLKNFYFLDTAKARVYAAVGDQRVEAEPNDIYTLAHFFGDSMSKKYSCSIRIPKEMLKGNCSFSICCEYEGKTLVLPVRFKKPQSHLFEMFPHAYCRVGRQYLTYRDKDRQFVLRKRNPIRGIAYELAFWGSMLKNGRQLLRSVKCIPLRLLYFLTVPFFGGHEIWMTFDQLFKGGDNGEYFYRYVSERQDKGNVRIYYVVNKGTKEYQELKQKYGNTVLAFNSLRHKLISLHTDYVFATRVAVNIYMGYWKQTERYFRDLLNAKVFCLQHGLTIQKIAQYQNRLYDNTRLYFCVSPAEVQNLLHPVYGYEEKELILTGAPRYDGLVNDDKRYILLSPTWRRNVTAGTNKKGSNHEYSPNFKHTEYFRIYNSLINDQRLIEAAQKYNYRLIYLIHPILSPQIKDFETNDYVEIIPGASDVSYEKMLSEASLMLTDHSGIQFDFAFMNKPLVYYHPESLPPQYEEGGLKYETEGFGSVCKTHEQVVDALCDYMSRNCEIDPLYADRIDRFFAFHDHDNCKRIYEAARQYIADSV